MLRFVLGGGGGEIVGNCSLSICLDSKGELRKRNIVWGR